MSDSLHPKGEEFEANAGNSHNLNSEADDLPISIPKTKRIRIVPLTVGGAILSLIALLFLFPPVRMGGEAARRTYCKNNLKQIGLAMSKYHDQYGTFPPAYTVDSEGNRLHSWRTLLLPHLDENELYNKINLSKPWDDAINQEVFKGRVVRCYNCLSSQRPPGLTDYCAIISDESCFPHKRSTSYRDIKDGSSNTLFIVEVDGGIEIPWMSPQDLDEKQFLNSESKTKSNHAHGFHALIADGTVRFINFNTPQETLQAAISRDAGDFPGDF